MAIEIERKFLLRNEDWRSAVQRSEHFCQGYLGGDHSTVRVRMEGMRARLTIKGRTSGIRRMEFEYAIPVADAEIMLRELCGERVLRKTRHFVPLDGHCFEIDEFEGANAPLVVAEIELQDEAASFPRPPWLGDEVSDDLRYFNSYLSQHPYSTWRSA